MEGEPEESDEDVQGEDKPTVLWEKCIQQSIFVDLSEDESLHLSDLESSLALHLSQAESAASEASIHLSAGSAELSALDVTSSESSIVSSKSERVVGSKTKSSILHVSAQRPNTMQDEPLNQGNEDPGQNTSDEDQDDLPYDGDLGSPYFNQTANSEGSMSSDGRETVHASPDGPGLLECNTRDRDDTIKCLVSVERNTEKPETLSQDNAKKDNFFDTSRKVASSCPCPADINQLLLRHFSQEELLRSVRLIEAETLPEVSLLESVDDTVFSWAPTHNSTTINSNHSESPACNSEINQSFCSGRTVEKSNTASTSSSLDDEAERKIDNVTSAATDSITSSSASIDSKQGSEDKSAVDVRKQEKAEEDDQVQRVPLVRTRSFSEMKYGQGQVHYPLPDFSKVAPKVKIPKAPSGLDRPVPQSPSTMHRAQSSPGMLEVISRILEDSVQPSEKPYIFKDEDKETPPALVHHLQAEYDKLLTKYAEAENLIDQMRLGTNAQPSSELMLYLECDDDPQGNPQPVVEGSHLGSLAPHLPPSEYFGKKGETTPHSNIKEVNTASSSQPEDGPSDGERMTTELRDIISQFMKKVEEFKLSVSNMSVSTAEQQMMLRSIMEAQDQLERKYISKKEEHRALEMQNYMGLSRNTGTFDPNRLVEGDIFRIGMHLEDIKEMIDKNMCEQISPPHSSSTPTPMKEMLHVKPSPLCMPTPSPPPSLHEGPSAGFSTAGYKMETWKEEEKEEEVTSKVHGDDGLQQSSELITIDCHHSSFRSSLGSLEGLEIQTAEAEEEKSSALSEVIDHSNILAYLSGTSSFSRQRQWTPNSSTPDSVLSPVGECDLGDCVILAVDVSSSSDAPRDSGTHSLSEPPLNTSSVSQRILSPETDSGFGSSYLNQSASGAFQPNLLTESEQSQNDGLSSSDSEGSCSNLQTAIHSSVQTQSCGAAGALEQWAENTTKEPSVRLQCEQILHHQHHHHVSEPVLSTTMDTKERGSPLYSCSCNSQAILALQSEVSKLKKDLEEGLVQLPHLTEKMDYLTFKYRQDRQECKSKTRSRTHHRPACNSVWKPSSSRQNLSNLSSSQVRIEDWISSDMEPSRSKGTGSGDTAGSEIMLQFHNSPVGSRRGSGSVHSAPEFQYKLQGALQLSKGSEGHSSVKTSDLTRSTLKGGKPSDSHAKQRPHRLLMFPWSAAIMESFYSKERWSLFSSPILQKPLLQVSYGSSSSLPASYKVREPPLQSTSHHRKLSTQSDTALLPSNVYFQRTLSPLSVPSKTGSRTGRRRGSKEEEMNRTLDQAIDVARSMKRTTDRMAKRLSADLAKAQLHRKLHNMQPLGGRKHQAL
ncbi:protein AKNAD1-like isoform X3 [Siniperca chuatsi]|uniref:protein AKNAD1-like isoform X3 n=1 Tax=Siniperca chuatsi TaxID=119488 RepID=UPI001CE0E291|nr:protein AKNAD1-like isoform X3 [Siniperca chuatsi]